MNLDDVKKLALATLISVTNRLLLLFGLVKLSDANVAVEHVYANAKAATKSLEDKAQFAYLEGGIDELSRIRRNLDEDITALGDLLNRDEVSAKELRTAYKLLLPQLHENIITVLSGRDVQKETEETEVSEG